MSDETTTGTPSTPSTTSTLPPEGTLTAVTGDVPMTGPPEPDLPATVADHETRLAAAEATVAKLERVLRERGFAAYL